MEKITKVKTKKIGVMTGTNTVTNEVSIMRIVDKTNNVYSGEKHLVPGDICITVTVDETTVNKPLFKIHEVLSIHEDSVDVSVLSPVDLIKRDFLTNSKLYSIIEEAKFLYRKHREY